MDAAQLRACRNYYVQLLKKLAADKRRFNAAAFEKRLLVVYRLK